MTEEQTAALEALRRIALGPKANRMDYVGTLSTRDAGILLSLMPDSAPESVEIHEPDVTESDYLAALTECARHLRERDRGTCKQDLQVAARSTDYSAPPLQESDEL